jgi:hypothetical protein
MVEALEEAVPEELEPEVRVRVGLVCEELAREVVVGSFG